MILCGIDLETTSADILTTEIVELSWVFMETPLFGSPPIVEQHFCLPHGPLSREAEAINLLNRGFLERHGPMKIKDAIWLLESALTSKQTTCIVAHNGFKFDRPILQRVAQAEGVSCPTLLSLPWVDTAMDLPADAFFGRKLLHMAAEVGFLNPFPHSAVFDIMTTFKVLASQDVEAVLVRAKEPWIYVEANVNYNTRELAKKQGYSWEKVHDKVFPKSWIKAVKVSELEVERARVDEFFTITILEPKIGQGV